jgi:putative membrane protein
VTAAVVLLVYTGAYLMRVRTLARRGRPVPAWRIAAFLAGIAVLAAALCGPVERLARSSFAEHMAEHLAIGDLGPLLITLGLTGALVAPLLRIGPLARLRALSHPVPAFLLWAADLIVWHFPFAYEGALRHDAVHALQHACFFVFGLNLWMPLLGPFPRPAWFGTPAQVGYVVAVRITGELLANVFVWSGTVFYPWYGRLGDQQAAGAVMMVEQSVVMVVLFGWLALRWIQEAGERQELAELARARGAPVDERRIARAVAAGRGAGLRRRLDEPSVTPATSDARRGGGPGID